MEVTVLVGGAEHRYEDGKDHKVLVDLEHGNLLIHKKYNKHIERELLNVYSCGTWNKFYIRV